MTMDFTRRDFLRACTIATTGALGACVLAGCASPAPASPTMRDLVRTLVAEMSIEAKVAQLFIVTPEQVAGFDDALQYADEAFAEGYAMRPVCGFNLFEGNIVNAEQTSGLIAGMKTAAADPGCIPPFCCVDEEGGTVQRIGGRSDFGAPFVGNMADIGATGDVALAAQTARDIANALRPLGFDVDFAPSCDIATSPASDMRKRSFGAEAKLVGQMATAQIRAFLDEGVLPCAKHFPGIGDPQQDSHVSSISTEKTREELAMELAPFVAAIIAGVPFVMVGHLALPQITGSAIPASISPDIVQGILRDDIGYDGVVLTDSLGMGALLEFCDPADVAVAAIEAGCDVALMPPDFPAAYDGLLDAVVSERISIERVDESLVRILSLKLRSMPQAFDQDVQEALAQCQDFGGSSS